MSGVDVVQGIAAIMLLGVGTLNVKQGISTLQGSVDVWGAAASIFWSDKERAEREAKYGKPNKARLRHFRGWADIILGIMLIIHFIGTALKLLNIIPDTDVIPLIPLSAMALWGLSFVYTAKSKRFRLEDEQGSVAEED